MASFLTGALGGGLEGGSDVTDLGPCAGGADPPIGFHSSPFIAAYYTNTANINFKSTLGLLQAYAIHVIGWSKHTSQ